MKNKVKLSVLLLILAIMSMSVKAQMWLWSNVPQHEIPQKNQENPEIAENTAIVPANNTVQPLTAEDTQFVASMERRVEALKTEDGQDVPAEARSHMPGGWGWNANGAVTLDEHASLSDGANTLQVFATASIIGTNGHWIATIVPVMSDKAWNRGQYVQKATIAYQSLMKHNTTVTVGWNTIPGGGQFQFAGNGLRDMNGNYNGHNPDTFIEGNRDARSTPVEGQSGFGVNVSRRIDKGTLEAGVSVGGSDVNRPMDSGFDHLRVNGSYTRPLDSDASSPNKEVHWTAGVHDSYDITSGDNYIGVPLSYAGKKGGVSGEIYYSDGVGFGGTIGASRTLFGGLTGFANFGANRQSGALSGGLNWLIPKCESLSLSAEIVHQMPFDSKAREDTSAGIRLNWGWDARSLFRSLR